MALIKFKAGEEYALRLSKLSSGADEIAKKGIYAGADVVADAMRESIEKIPHDSFRRLVNDGDLFTGISNGQRRDLLESFGITPFGKDDHGNWNTKLGFDGYGSFPTAKYPNGVPNQLLARAIESGSEVRVKRPFVAPVVRRMKKPAVDVMNKTVNDEIEKIMKK